MWPANAEDI